MKTVLILISCCAIVSMGVFDVYIRNRSLESLDDAVKLVVFFKTELNYRCPDFNTLCSNAQKQGFRCFHYADGRAILSDSLLPRARAELQAFFDSIGTTDASGQLQLCDEYIQRLKLILAENRAKEKSKTQVNLALSVLGALTVVVLFI